jgi:hypothetical protein
MKHVITLIVLLAASALAEVPNTFKWYPPHGTSWAFEMSLDTTDHWDSTSSEHPPLSPQKAKDLATAFVQQVPPYQSMTGWSISTITLRLMSRDPELWIYEVQFEGTGASVWGGPLPLFTVPVKMDGTIPIPIK